MRNNLLFTSSIAWLAFLGMCLVIFQVVKGQIMLPANNTPPASSSNLSEANSDTQISENQVAKTNFGEHVCLDFSILPDLEMTAESKTFLENIHFLGYIGRNGAFQANLSTLSVKHIIANFLLRPDGISLINTVQITPNMLSIEQLQECYIFTNILLRDINNMYSFASCNAEQIEVLNNTSSRLMFLKSTFKRELLANDAFDSAFDTNSVTMDFLEHTLQADNKTFKFK